MELLRGAREAAPGSDKELYCLGAAQAHATLALAVGALNYEPTKEPT